MKEKRDCKIIQDLLPNYIEKLTSETTNEFIESHLRECNECKKVFEGMKKEVRLTEEKQDGREVEYIKKYNKKMKLWKKILFTILGIIVIYMLTVLYKYNILTKIQERNQISNSSTNYYYSSISNDTIMECFKKDGIVKVNLKLTNGNGDITMWKNSNTGEALCFWNTQKLYSKDTNGIIETAPSSVTSSPDLISRLVIAANPMVFIGTQKYNDISCYNIKFANLYEIIEKETGLILYSNDESYTRIIEYSFNTVTDEDIQTPDISQYNLK